MSLRYANASLPKVQMGDLVKEICARLDLKVDEVQKISVLPDLVVVDHIIKTQREFIQTTSKYYWDMGETHDSS